MKHTLTSNRNFGYLIASFFLILAIYVFFKSGSSILIVLFFLSSLFFLGLSIAKPHLLSSLNKAWFLLGQFLGRVMSPIVLGVIFFLLITPLGLIANLFGRDELRLRRKSCSTYWTQPLDSSPDAESFKDQF
jgi:hypothetical protein